MLISRSRLEVHRRVVVEVLRAWGCGDREGRSRCDVCRLYKVLRRCWRRCEFRWHVREINGLVRCRLVQWKGGWYSFDVNSSLRGLVRRCYNANAHLYDKLREMLMKNGQEVYTTRI